MILPLCVSNPLQHYTSHSYAELHHYSVCRRSVGYRSLGHIHLYSLAERFHILHSPAFAAGKAEREKDRRGKCRGDPHFIKFHISSLL